jgi:hypothetical protein
MAPKGTVNLGVKNRYYMTGAQVQVLCTLSIQSTDRATVDLVCA